MYGFSKGSGFAMVCFFLVVSSSLLIFNECINHTFILNRQDANKMEEAMGILQSKWKELQHISEYTNRSFIYELAKQANEP